MWKFFRGLLIILLLLIVGLFIFVFSFLDSIAYQATSDDLPQDVYEYSGDLLALVRDDIQDLFLADEEDRYTITEEIVNLIILDSIRDGINADYDPLATDCEDTDCGMIIEEEYFYVDYAYAKINDDNQLVITISFGANKYVDNTTALIMVFDIEFDMDFELNPLLIFDLSVLDDMEVVFTLNDYSLGEKSMSMNLLDYIFNQMNKDSIEDSMTFGTLDLDDYTFSISIRDAFE